MKSFFVFKDGDVFGSPVGYTTIKGAQKSVVGCEDWYKLLRKYDKGNGRQQVPQESIDLGLYKWFENTKSFLFQREVWSRKIWNPYVKEHYKIEEKEFEIVFKDN